MGCIFFSWRPLFFWKNDSKSEWVSEYRIFFFPDGGKSFFFFPDGPGVINNPHKAQNLNPQQKSQSSTKDRSVGTTKPPSGKKKSPSEKKKKKSPSRKIMNEWRMKGPQEKKYTPFDSSHVQAGDWSNL